MDFTPFLDSLDGAGLDDVLLSMEIPGRLAIAMNGRFLLRAVCESLQNSHMIGCAVTDAATCLAYLARAPMPCCSAPTGSNPATVSSWHARRGSDSRI